MLAQQRGLPSYHTRSNAVILHDTLPAEFIEKAICMKTKDQLYRRESVVLRPRVVLEANSQSGSQDLPVQEARSSWEFQQFGETRSNTADYRIPEKSISTVKLQDALIALLFQTSGSFIAFAVGNLKYSRSPTTLQKTNCDFTKANMAAIQQYFQGGTTKKNTESHWRSTTLAKRKSR